jgi:hypothetical protein
MASIFQINTFENFNLQVCFNAVDVEVIYSHHTYESLWARLGESGKSGWPYDVAWRLPRHNYSFGFV